MSRVAKPSACQIAFNSSKGLRTNIPQLRKVSTVSYSSLGCLRSQNESLVCRLVGRVAKPSACQTAFNSIKELRANIPQLRRVSTISCSSLDCLRSQWDIVCSSMQRFGAVLISAPVKNKDLSIDKTAQLFGSLQGHGKCDQSGVMSVTCGAKYSGRTRKNIHFDGPFFPHTDGAYLDGAAYDQRIGCMRRVTPPKVIGLRAIETPKKGGETILVDGQLILKELILTRSALLPNLLRGDGNTFFHGPIMCVNLPFFRQQSTGLFQMRYSYDQEFHYPMELVSTYNSFHKKYVEASQFRLEIKLEPGDTLFIDNHRMLHGRNDVQGNRLYQRVWVSQDPIPLTYPESQSIHYDAQQDTFSCTQPYSKYLPLPSSISPSPSQFNPGITLNPQEQADLTQLLI